MPKLPDKKVGIVACSGEEIAEGTVTRLAALKVLEELRPSDTVTICLPLFLAGGEGDRAFARYYPTIAVDGCELRCAARATEEYSGKPAASIVVTELVAENGLDRPAGRRRLNEAGQQAVMATADQIATQVDDLLGRKWSRRKGEFADEHVVPVAQPAAQATCSCGSGIPILDIQVNGETITLIAVPAIFEMFHGQGKQPSAETTAELMEQVKIYNPILDDCADAYAAALAHEYAAYCGAGEVVT
jgi:uncharacterized metal-binding protein